MGFTIHFFFHLPLDEGRGGSRLNIVGGDTKADEFSFQPFMAQGLNFPFNFLCLYLSVMQILQIYLIIIYA